MAAKNVSHEEWLDLWYSEDDFDRLIAAWYNSLDYKPHLRRATLMAAALLRLIPQPHLGADGQKWINAVEQLAENTINVNTAAVFGARILEGTAVLKEQETSPHKLGKYFAARAISDSLSLRATESRIRYLCGLLKGTFKVPHMRVTHMVKDIVGNPLGRHYRTLCTRCGQPGLFCGYCRILPERSGPEAWKVAWEDNCHWLTADVKALAREAYDKRTYSCFCDHGWLTSSDRAGEIRYRCDVCGGSGVAPSPDRRMDPVRLGILADALEESGCTDEELLRHLRGYRICGGCRAMRRNGNSGHSCDGGYIVDDTPRYSGSWSVDYLLNHGERCVNENRS
jgi:hypothetical protein